VFDKLPQNLRDLLDFTNRQRLASWVNEIILESMGYQSEHQLGFYWQMTQWSQKELANKAKQEGITVAKKDSGIEADNANEGQDLVYPVLHSPMGDLSMQNACPEE